MQKAEKTNELSASAEQKLPVPPAGVTGEELPGRIVLPTNALPRQDKVVSGTPMILVNGLPYDLSQVISISTPSPNQ